MRVDGKNRRVNQLPLEIGLIFLVQQDGIEVVGVIVVIVGIGIICRSIIIGVVSWGKSYFIWANIALYIVGPFLVFIHREINKLRRIVDRIK